MDRRRLASAVLALMVTCAGCSAPEPTQTHAEPLKPASAPTPKPTITPQPTSAPAPNAPVTGSRLAVGAHKGQKQGNHRAIDEV